jgi:hypothetical protein
MAWVGWVVLLDWTIKEQKVMIKFCEHSEPEMKSSQPEMIIYHLRLLGVSRVCPAHVQQYGTQTLAITLLRIILLTKFSLRVNSGSSLLLATLATMVVVELLATTVLKYVLAI